MTTSRALCLGLLVFPNLLTAQAARASDPCHGGIMARLTELGYDSNQITEVRTSDNSTVINQKSDWLTRHAQPEIDRIKAANPPGDSELPNDYRFRLRTLIDQDPSLRDNLAEQQKIDRLLVNSDVKFDHVVVYTTKGKPPTVVARVFESQGKIVSFTTYSHDENISKDPRLNDTSSGQRCNDTTASVVPLRTEERGGAPEATDDSTARGADDSTAKGAE